MAQKLPSGFGLYWSAAVASINHSSEKNLSLIAAGVAFYSMLSLFPAIAALIAILSLVSNPAVVVAQLEEIRGVIPDDVYDIINTQVVALVTTSTDTLGWAGILSLLVAFWSARNGVGAMMIGLNAVYNERNRNLAHHFLRALLLTFTLVMVGIVALLTLVVVPVILAFFPLGAISTLLIDVIRWAIAIGVIFAGIAMLYRFGPNRKAARAKWLSVGAVFAVLSWAVVSVGFSYYVANFGNYNQVYGSIGAVIAMLVWLWMTSFLVLLGAALNAQIELRTRWDSTVGHPKPMGKRGAYMADNLVVDDAST